MKFTSVSSDSSLRLAKQCYGKSAQGSSFLQLSRVTDLVLVTLLWIQVFGVVLGNLSEVEHPGELDDIREAKEGAGISSRILSHRDHYDPFHEPDTSEIFDALDGDRNDSSSSSTVRSDSSMDEHMPSKKIPLSSFTMSFQEYMVAYNKKYDSTYEYMVRLKVFVARMMRVFASQVAYKLRLKTYWLKVNSRTDYLLDELKAMELRNDFDYNELNSSVAEWASGKRSDAEAEDVLIGGEDSKRLVALIGHKEEPIAEEEEGDLIANFIRGEINILNKGGQHSSTENGSKSAELKHQYQANGTDTQLTASEMGPPNEGLRAKVRSKFSIFDHLLISRKTISDFQLSKESLVKIWRGHKQMPASTNPDYLEPERASFGVGFNGAQEKSKPMFDESDFKKMYFYNVDMSPDKMSKPFRNLPVKSRYKIYQHDQKSESLKATHQAEVRSLKARMADEPDAEKDTALGQTGLGHLFKIAGLVISGMGEMFGKDEEGPQEVAADVVWVDHRDSNCFWPPEEQSDCSSCYIVVVKSFLEWAYCKQTGKLIKFSAQYPLDCGRRFFSDLRGCQGGKFTSVFSFFQNFGIELENHYPYRAKEEHCPYDESVKHSSMGYLRFKANEVLTIPVEFFEYYLKFAPIIINIGTRGDFYEYAGGVHDGKSCGFQATHSVLLIGHGREEGEEYWLIRNSMSVDFGEQGYYKLNKNSDCIHPAVGFMFATKDAQNFTLFAEKNPKFHQPGAKT